MALNSEIIGRAGEELALDEIQMRAPDAKLSYLKAPVDAASEALGLVIEIKTLIKSANLDASYAWIQERIVNRFTRIDSEKYPRHLVYFPIKCFKNESYVRYNCNKAGITVCVGKEELLDYLSSLTCMNTRDYAQLYPLLVSPEQVKGFAEVVELVAELKSEEIARQDPPNLSEGSARTFESAIMQSYC